MVRSHPYSSFIGFSIALLAIALPLFFFHSSIFAATPTSTISAHIVLAQPMTTDEALAFASSYALTPVYFEHQFDLGQTTTGFFGLTEIAPADVQTAMTTAYQTFLANAIRSLEREDSDGVMPQEDRDALRAFIQEHKEALAAGQDPVFITAMTVDGTSTAVQSLQNVGDPRVQEIDVSAESSGAQPQEGTFVGFLKTMRWFSPVFAVNYETWVPEYGGSDVWPISSQSAYNYQSMNWDNINGFARNSTYEHDFFLNNYDGKTYLDKREVPIDFPRLTYAASNLPRPYIDTRFSDDRSELAYTIGSADGWGIRKNKWYYTYMELARGNTSFDSGKLSAQLGHRSPSSCYSTWCSFADQTERIIRAWNMSIPGGMSWSK